MAAHGEDAPGMERQDRLRKDRARVAWMDAARRGAAGKRRRRNATHREEWQERRGFEGLGRAALGSAGQERHG